MIYTPKPRSRVVRAIQLDRKRWRSIMVTIEELRGYNDPTITMQVMDNVRPGVYRRPFEDLLNEQLTI